MKTDVICVGLTCADVLIQGVDLTTPFEGESKPADTVTVSVGGDAANQAIVLSKMGVKAKLMTGIGNDAVSAMIRQVFEQAGVEMSETKDVAGTSAVNVVVIAKDGQRNFINSGLPESTFFTPDLSKLKDASVISLGSIGVPPFMDAKTVTDTAKVAKASGAIVCADVIYNPGSATLEELKEALSCIDYIFPNEEEARLLTGKETLDEIADVFLEYGIQTVLIKIGKDGVFVKNRESSRVYPAIGKKVVDTTGAGDNFAAGFITGLVEGKELSGCVELAAATAGVAIQSVGATTGVTGRSQVEEHLQKYR